MFESSGSVDSSFALPMGSGERFFKDDIGTTPLELIQTRTIDLGVTLLCYKPAEDRYRSPMARQVLRRIAWHSGRVTEVYWRSSSQDCGFIWLIIQRMPNLSVRSP